jgi:hypothetical protein
MYNRILLLVATAILIGGCSTKQDKLEILPEKDKASQSLPADTRIPAQPPRAADALWAPGEIEQVDVPGRVAGKVFYPAHREPLVVTPSGFRKLEAPDKSNEQPAPKKSAYVPGGKGLLPSRMAGQEPTSPEQTDPVPTVTAMFRGEPLGEALRDLLTPLGMKPLMAPNVNSSVPITLRAEKRPLHMVLADLLKPYGYRAVIDLGRREVRID